MRTLIFLLILGILLINLVSADIIIDKQPDQIYNLGDSFSIPITIKSVTEVTGIFQMNLICGGQEINFYKNGVSLSSGEERKMEPFIILTKNLIGESKGICKIKGIFLEEYILTNEFEIVNLIDLKIKNEKIVFNPGENIIIEGDAIKLNGKSAEGFIELNIISDNSSKSINQLSTITKGYFAINILLPKNMKAGSHLIKLNAYEKDYLEEITNTGTAEYEILINQIPTNIEILFENNKVEPGTNVKFKTILHDQTGENINAIAIITVKDENNKILEQTDIQTDEFFEFPISYNEPPLEWSIVAVSNKLTSEAKFKINEKQDVKIELINKTIILTNIGNIPYNKIVLIKVGNDSLNINASLKVDETQKYLLTAPDGEYEVEIITEEGSIITGMATLTGKTIEVRENSGKVFSIVKYSVVWMFMIFILGFVVFIVFKKGYKRSFFGYIHSKKKENVKHPPKNKTSFIDVKNKAELSLSLTGHKQNVSVVCLKIKNFDEIKSKKTNVGDTLQKIINLAEKEKAATYETGENLFFILSPIKTKTFKNEKAAINLAQQARIILNHHNKLFNQKLEFGISINNGYAVIKQEGNTLQFMSLGTLALTAKKLASFYENEILISEEANEKIKSNFKTEKKQDKNTIMYVLGESKNKDEHKKFLTNFLSSIEKEKNNGK